MTIPGSPSDPAARQQWRAARREAVREHHPDRGGDAETMNRALAEVDARFGVGVSRSTRVAVRRTPLVALRRGLGSSVRRSVRRVRRSLPRRWPGHRRYHDI